MSDTAAAEALLAAASPGPWFLDGFDLHDAGTWMIAVMAREGNPSTKSDPKATAQLAALAPEVTAVAVGAVKALEAADAKLGGTGQGGTCGFKEEGHD